MEISIIIYFNNKLHTLHLQKITVLFICRKTLLSLASQTTICRIFRMMITLVGCFERAGIICEDYK